MFSTSDARTPRGRAARLAKAVAKPVAILAAIAFTVGIGNLAVAKLADQQANADTIPLTGATPSVNAASDWDGTYNCDTLYAVSRNQHIYSLNTATAGTTTLGESWNNWTVPFGLRADTMALGYYPGTKTLTAYYWYYSAQLSKQDLVGYTSADVPDDNFYTAVAQLTSGNTTAVKTFAVPNPGTTAVTSDPRTSFDFWSGGEVDQLTGEIYFSGGENAQITTTNKTNTMRFMRYDPETGNAINSGPLQAEPGTTPLDGVYPSSDMAVDAEGNLYNLVGGADKQLIRVTPSSTSDWTYSLVGSKKISSDAIGADTNIWGVAFLDGTLYADNASDDNQLAAIDPLSMTAKKVGNVVGEGAHEAIEDLASCQAAPVIRGTIYNDANGNGKIDSGEGGVANQTVEIYGQDRSSTADPKPLKYLGDQTTNENGEYSFLVNSLKDEDKDLTGVFYIRVKQPQINGVNAAQTWAGGTTTTTGSDNKVEPLCYSSTSGDYTPLTADGKCLGARGDGIDHNLSTTASGTDPTNATSGADIVTRVTMAADTNV
ncbi:MAG: hypothetical protein LBM66_03540, partial [Bifidobacteriaceae bacterium]|nr:hypothetical protein [Bifidobacteriaceae bacterium]